MNLEFFSGGLFKDTDTGVLYRHEYAPIGFLLKDVAAHHEMYSCPKIIYDYNYRARPDLNIGRRDEWIIDTYNAIKAEAVPDSEKLGILHDGRWIEKISLNLMPMPQSVSEGAKILAEDKDSIDFGCLYEDVEEGPPAFKLDLHCPEDEFFYLHGLLMNGGMSSSTSLKIEIWLQCFEVDRDSEDDLHKTGNVYYIEDIFAPMQALLKRISVVS